MMPAESSAPRTGPSRPTMLSAATDQATTDTTRLTNWLRIRLATIDDHDPGGGEARGDADQVGAARRTSAPASSIRISTSNDDADDDAEIVDAEPAPPAADRPASPWSGRRGRCARRIAPQSPSRGARRPRSGRPGSAPRSRRRCRGDMAQPASPASRRISSKPSMRSAHKTVIRPHCWHPLSVEQRGRRAIRC